MIDRRWSPSSQSAYVTLLLVVHTKPQFEFLTRTLRQALRLLWGLASGYEYSRRTAENLWVGFVVVVETRERVLCCGEGKGW